MDPIPDNHKITWTSPYADFCLPNLSSVPRPPLAWVKIFISLEYTLE